MVTPDMDAQELLTLLHHFLEDHYGFRNFDSQPKRYNPRGVGPFGLKFTDRYSQSMMLNGERFTVTIEKDPNQ